MSKTSLLGSAVSPFAHLFTGRASAAAAAPAAAAKAETDDEKKKREDEEAAAAKKAEEEDEDKKKKREDEEDEEDEEEEEAKKKAKSKSKSKAEQDDDDENDASSKAIRSRERERCAAIFADPAAAKRPDVAAQLAFGTPLNREMALSTLRAVAAGEREPAAADKPDFRTRMEQVPNPDLGGNDGAPAGSDGPSASDFILAADKRRRGEKS